MLSRLVWLRHALLRHAQGTPRPAEQGIAEEEALKKGMEEKSKEFMEKGAEVYPGARLWTKP
jgi:hypothetical protein